MLTELKIYLTCFAAIIAIDFLWIGLLMKNFYINQLRPIGRITGDQFEPNLWAALVVYVALSVGIVEFVLPKLQQDSSWLSTFWFGALLGLVVYGTYDFTNYSTLKDWTLALTIVDVIWGAVLCGIVSIAAQYVRHM